MCALASRLGTPVPVSACAAEEKTSIGVLANRVATTIAVPCSASRCAGSVATVIANTTSMPRTASRSDPASFKSPTATAMPDAASYRPAPEAGSRVNARTRFPARCNSRATAPPCRPAAPMTRTLVCNMGSPKFGLRFFYNHVPNRLRVKDRYAHLSQRVGTAPNDS
jgi:hypothetical protein